MMFASARGVLKQRASPNARCRPEGDAEHAALARHFVEHIGIGVGNVLTEHADAFVARHLLVQREPDGFAERHRLGAFGNNWRAGFAQRRSAPP